MTEQPVETEEQFLGNVTKDQLREAARYGTTPLQQYVPNAHRMAIDYKPWPIDVPAAEATFVARAKQADLWLDAEEQATRALAEIQDGNINAGIACLQAALAFAQNYRHSLTEDVAR